MNINQQKEQFSNAYLCAVTAVAGYTCYKPNVDIESVDWGITAVGVSGTFKSPKIELQLKCTSQNVMGDEFIRFPLNIKNYDDLRHINYMVPRILVVVVVPDKIEKWLNHSELELTMRHCGYWMSLYGEKEKDNTETVTVYLPRKQQFTVDNLKHMMYRIGNGELP
ncbi:MAG: DUF4365 domain-containing protein [Nitrospirae bacterium]|nr:DUF4365 domain-containing protein [Nitrospirota bacterium]MBF0533866.1 DUF4365 domain-containing protein [Nitrospirota bacterium]MBF0615425.1 DUF4365 domain-containing protein [Nitrospirota bacterium]